MPQAADEVESAFAKIRAALQAGMERAAQEGQEFVEEEIDTPVERDFSGEVTVRSVPGEPPRLDTGQLHGNVEHATYGDKDVIGLVVGVSRPDTPEVPAILEGPLNREFMAPAWTKTAQDFVPAALADAIRNVQ